MSQEREQQQKPVRRGTQDEPEAEQAKSGLPKKGKKLRDDLDKILDDIDSVLEENAEEFVKSYVQRGGE